MFNVIDEFACIDEIAVSLPARVLVVRMLWFDFSLTVLLTLLLSSKSESRLKQRDRSLWGFLDSSISTVGFSSEEWRLDTVKGTIVGSYPVHGVGSVRKLENEDEDTSSFVDITLDKQMGTLNFSLARDLQEFRVSHWSASLEISYEIGRWSDPTCVEEYTFMLIIEDCNLHSPKFQKVEEIPIYLPWPDDDDLPLTRNPIVITDADINFQFANITVSCTVIDGSFPCDNFRIEKAQEVNETNDGYVHSVKIYLLQNSSLNRLEGIDVENDTNYTFTVGLVASDSVHEHDETTIVTFRVTPFISNNNAASEGSSFPIAPVAGIASLLLVLALAGFTYTTWRNRQTKNILRKLTEQEIREFLDGTAGFGEGTAKRSVDCNIPILAKPYNRAFEIPRDRLRIDETTILGSGFFGVVMRGSIQHENGESTTVAVKAVKRNVGALYFKALLSELKIMAFIGRHNNVVSLMGACTHNIRKREVFIAVEFCENGNLHNYLRTHRLGFVNMVQDGALCAISESYAYKRKGSTQPPVSTLDLLRWSMQIASGLDYLGSLGVIHGDLATRNVLLDSKRICKIADFGLSRRLIDVSSYYYTKQSQAPLPWKWMSIESLKDAKFSKKSDIWSFGVTLWEIFTLGNTPFGGLNWDETFVDRLDKGLRLPHPPFATEAIYDIMKDCWEADPHHRPAIFDVKRLLEGMANTLLTQAHDDDGYFKVLDVNTEDSTVDYEKFNTKTLPREVMRSSPGMKHYADYRLGQAEC